MKGPPSRIKQTPTDLVRHCHASKLVRREYFDELCDYSLSFDLSIGGVALRAVHIALNGVDTGTDSGYMAIDTSEVTPNTGFHAVTANLGNSLASQLDPASQQFEVTITMKGADLAACGPVNDETVTVQNLALIMANQIQN